MNTNPSGLSEFSRKVFAPLGHMSNNHPFEEQLADNLPEGKEARWAEVRKCSEFITRYAIEAQHRDVTKENYYDLYNMAVCLLKAVDSLDPDKLPPTPAPNPTPHVHAKLVKVESSHPDITGSNVELPGVPASPIPYPQYTQPQTAMITPAHNNNIPFDYYYQRSAYDGFGYPRYTPNEINTMYAHTANLPFSTSYLAFPQQQAPPPQIFHQPQPIKPENQIKGETIDTMSHHHHHHQQQQQQHHQQLDEDEEDEGTKKKRRRRSAPTAKRNLHCHSCGATETPEWRRGPEGEHTLCNACGLHYAKDLKKQKKEQDKNSNTSSKPPPDKQA